MEPGKSPLGNCAGPGEGLSVGAGLGKNKQAAAPVQQCPGQAQQLGHREWAEEGCRSEELLRQHQLLIISGPERSDRKG